MPSPSSPAYAAKTLVDTVLRAGTRRAFVAAFNAVMKQACPQRALQLVVMTTDTFQKYPALVNCTFLGRNYWSEQDLKGGKRARGRGRASPARSRGRASPAEDQESDAEDQESDAEDQESDAERQEFFEARIPGWRTMSNSKRAAALAAAADAAKRAAVAAQADAESAAAAARADADAAVAAYEAAVAEHEAARDTALHPEYISIGFYLVENTSCVASIELNIKSSSDEEPPDGHVGSIYARTHSDRQKLDLYSLVMAATVLYTASFAFKFPRSAARPAKLDRLHSEAIVVPSMWVLRPYTWASPDAHEFDKEQNDTYAAYQQYYDDLDEGAVHIELLPRHNRAAAGRVLLDLCAKNKFCHSLPRLDLPLKKTRKALDGGRKGSGRRQESLWSSKRLQKTRQPKSRMKQPKSRRLLRSAKKSR